MSIRDNLEINLYNSLTNNNIAKFEYYKIINDTQSVMVIMNIEELLLWKKIQEQIISKNDIMLKFGYKG